MLNSYYLNIVEKTSGKNLSHSARDNNVCDTTQAIDLFIYLFIYNEYLFATGLPLQHAKLLFFKWVLWGLKYTIKFPIHIYQ